MFLEDLRQSIFRQIAARTFVGSGRAVALTLVVLATGVMTGQVAPPPAEQAEQLRQAGLAQVTGGHVDEAIATFRRGLEIAPKDARLLDATGAAYSLKNDLQTARRYFVESLEVDPKSESTRQNLGITTFALGEYREASRQFASLYALPGKPGAVASLFLGLIAQRQSNCKTAVPLMEASDGLLYQYPDALLSYSECAYQMGDAKRAQEALAAFEKLAGKTRAQSQQAADLYRRLGMLANAPHDRNNDRGAASDAPAGVLTRARQFEAANRLDEAQRLLETEPSSHASFDLLLEMAKIANERGDLATAMKSLKRASQIDPAREESYLQFSTICADHGNDQLALETAEIGLDHVPDSYRLTVQKGAVQEKLGNLNAAEETLRKSLGMQKDNSIAMLSLAVVQAHSGRPNEAEETLGTAIRQFPDNYYMHYFRGKLLMQGASGKPDLNEAARRSFEESIRLNPDYADSYYQISGLFPVDAPKLAEQALQRCLKLDPNHIPAQYALARLYLRTGRKEQGQALLARLKTQQRAEELQQQRQLRIDVAQN